MLNMNIWEGVYSNFKEIPVIGKGFDDDRWINSLLKKLSMARALSTNKKNASDIATCNDSLLPLPASVINNRFSSVNILDFGGGLGIDYIKTVRAMEGNKKIKYHIIEKEKICIIGRKIFRDDKRIEFHASFPKKLKVDIAHINSSLQYIENWKEHLCKMADYKPGYFLFTNLGAGNIPTYATVQNYYGSRIPCWFFNINDIKCVMAKKGFELLFMSAYIGTFFGRPQQVPQLNFPLKYRLGHACNLLFCRSES